MLIQRLLFPPLWKDDMNGFPSPPPGQKVSLDRGRWRSRMYPSIDSTDIWFGCLVPKRSSWGKDEEGNTNQRLYHSESILEVVENNVCRATCTQNDKDNSDDCPPIHSLHSKSLQLQKCQVWMTPTVNPLVLCRWFCSAVSPLFPVSTKKRKTSHKVITVKKKKEEERKEDTGGVESSCASRMQTFQIWCPSRNGHSSEFFVHPNIPAQSWFLVHFTRIMLPYKTILLDWRESRCIRRAVAFAVFWSQRSWNRNSSSQSRYDEVNFTFLWSTRTRVAKSNCFTKTSCSIDGSLVWRTFSRNSVSLLRSTSHSGIDHLQD